MTVLASSSVPLPPIAPPLDAKPIVIASAQTNVPAQPRPAAPPARIGKSGGGLASWYGDRFHGRRTASGERFDMGGFTAAHRSFPLPSYVRVTNVSNGRSIVVRVNDRGPFHGGRVIDVSRRTADVLGFRGHGVGTVKLDYIGAAPESSDDRRLLASYQEFGRPAAAPGMQVATLAPVTDADLAAEAGSGGAYAVASRAVSRTADYVVASAESAVSTARSAASATAQTAKAAVRRILPAAGAAPAEAPAAPVAYAAQQPALASAPPVIATGQASEPKRVVQPGEPVLASATPALSSSVSSTPDVSSRIASSFDMFGAPRSTFTTGGSVTAEAAR
ncbi:septal ring lytic transglycosylase RlpA family protein [Chelatococcus sambhunathii]|uniref:Endolytic peptidoglycan transglycosylase RlpA n=2 Tax=Chelatococcus sambhunathii TaxID=363953 RepID=A0ABU1DFY6_9HYPH|nr:septal ring lytic transglycosylase RlpA family protein [Chelatococcus sambhunathii]